LGLAMKKEIVLFYFTPMMASSQTAHCNSIWWIVTLKEKVNKLARVTWVGDLKVKKVN